MNSSNYSPSTVKALFRSLLHESSPSHPSMNSHQQLTSAPPPPTTATITATTTETLTGPPAKNSIKYIENDQNNRRQKYDGSRWRLVCTWNNAECTNLAVTHQLCSKHNALRRNKELPKKKKKLLMSHTSLPTIVNPYNHNNVRYSYNINHQRTIQNHNNHNDDDDDDDDDIQILEDYCKNPTIRRCSLNSNVKSEHPDFNVFSVEYANETDALHNIKTEPTASSSYRTTTNPNDIEYVASKTRSNGLNIDELMAKNLPPLTDFEEEFLATRLMENFPTNCSMLDARLFLHNEAISVVKRNYRIKMDAIAPEYFYDFLLRHPRIALHYSRWFLHCKPIPPTTGCPIDTKIWTISMFVRGAMNSDEMDTD